MQASKWVYGDEVFWGATLIDVRFRLDNRCIDEKDPCFPKSIIGENIFLMKAGAYHIYKKSVAIGLSLDFINEISIKMGSPFCEGYYE